VFSTDKHPNSLGPCPDDPLDAGKEGQAHTHAAFYLVLCMGGCMLDINQPGSLLQPAMLCASWMWPCMQE